MTQQVARPSIDERGIGGAGEPHRGEKIRTTPRGHPAFAGTLVARTVAVHRVATRAPAVAAMGVRLKPGLVDINPIRRTPLDHDLAQRAPVRYPLFWIARSILEGLFLRVIFMCFKALPMTLRSTPQNVACSRKVASG